MILPHVLPENILAILMFSLVVIFLSVMLAESIESIFHVIIVSVDKLAHRIESVDMIGTRARESMASSNCFWHQEGIF